MRDVRGLVSDISYVDPVEGIRLRGFTIPDAIKQLPKPAGAEMPYTGGVYSLLLSGKVPTREQALDVEREWQERGQVPGYVFEVIKAMPVDTHPMTLFSQAVLAMQRESEFARQYHNGLQRADYWE